MLHENFKIVGILITDSPLILLISFLVGCLYIPPHGYEPSEKHQFLSQLKRVNPKLWIYPFYCRKAAFFRPSI
jgi:hypothetical protein